MSTSSASSRPSKHVCPDCGRSYKAAETMNRHRKNHSATSQYVCSICTASFKRKDLLDRHTQIHVGGRPTTNRNRSQRACDRCSRLKTRCDNASPCTRCAKGGHDCTYKHIRSRARTDRSSIVSNSNSSVHSSPMMVAEDVSIFSPASTSSPDVGSTPEPTASPSPDDGWVDSLWMQDPVWQWPQIDPTLHMMDTAPKTAPPATMTTLEPIMVLDPALEADMSSSPSFESLPPSSLYDDPCESMSWYTKPYTNLQTLASAASYCESSDASSHHAHDSRLPSPDSWIPDDPQLMQQQVVEQLAKFSTATFNNAASESKDREQYWLRSAKKAEHAFNMEDISPVSSHIFQHFHDLFFKCFHTSWSRRQSSPAASFPPHLYLTMAAIGAAYAGPSAAPFHQQMLDALRPRLTQAAIERQLSDEATVPLIQSLALIEAAMLYFADRGALESAPQLTSIMVSLCRRIQLFNEAKFAQAQTLLGSGASNMDTDTRRRLANGVSKLDAHVGLLFGTRPLLSAEESRVCGAATSQDDSTLTRFLQQSGPTQLLPQTCWDTK